MTEGRQAMVFTDGPGMGHENVGPCRWVTLIGPTLNTKTSADGKYDGRLTTKSARRFNFKWRGAVVCDDVWASRRSKWWWHGAHNKFGVVCGTNPLMVFLHVWRGAGDMNVLVRSCSWPVTNQCTDQEPPSMHCHCTAEKCTVLNRLAMHCKHVPAWI